MLTSKFSEILNPPKPIDGDKIALDIITKHGLKVRKK